MKQASLPRYTRDAVSDGLICLLSCVEPCLSLPEL